MSDPVGDPMLLSSLWVCVCERDEVTRIYVKIWKSDSEPRARRRVVWLHVPRAFNWWGFSPAVWRWVRRWMDGHRKGMNRLGEAAGSLGADTRVISWTYPTAAAQSESSNESGAGVDDGGLVCRPGIIGHWCVSLLKAQYYAHLQFFISHPWVQV